MSRAVRHHGLHGPLEPSDGGIHLIGHQRITTYGAYWTQGTVDVPPACDTQELRGSRPNTRRQSIDKPTPRTPNHHMTMTFRGRPRHPSSPKSTAVAAFARLAGIWFLGLSGLYAVYMWTAFMGLREEEATLGSLVMVAGPMTFALSLLVAPAIFAAARDRFDVSGCETPGTRALQWVLLVAVALAAYVLSAFGPTIAVSVLVATQGTQPEPAPEASGSLLQAARSLLPVTAALFTIVSGCAGALIGHVTSGWRPRERDVAHWLACLALVASFLLPLLIATSFILNRAASAAWIILGPLLLPTLLTALLAWSKRHSLGMRIGRQFASTAASVDPKSLDRIVSAVAQGSALDLDTVARTRPEGEMAHFASAIRRIAAPTATLSEGKAKEIVRALQPVPAAAEPTITRRKRLRLELTRIGGFYTGWTCLAAGLLLVSPIGGVPMSVVPAVAVGFVGSAGIVWIASRGPRPTAMAST